MATIKIPERYKPGFAALAGLSDSSFEELLAALRQAPNTFSSTRELEVWVSSEVKTVTPGDVGKIAESISSVYRLLSKYGWTISTLASALVDASQRGIDNLKVTEGSDFKARIATLLSNETFNIVTLKAKELQAEAERTFCEARVLTDIRPIFGDAITDGPTAAIVVHTLRITAHEGATHKEFYVALDSDDISALKKTLERAEEKALSLKALVDKSGLRAIDLSQKE